MKEDGTYAYRGDKERIPILLRLPASLLNPLYALDMRDEEERDRGAAISRNEAFKRMLKLVIDRHSPEFRR